MMCMVLAVYTMYIQYHYFCPCNGNILWLMKWLSCYTIALTYPLYHLYPCYSSSVSVTPLKLARPFMLHELITSTSRIHYSDI